MDEETQAFNRGENVPNDGEYVCVPCGFKKEYKKGEQFGECLSCMAGSNTGPEEYAEGLELWEKVSQ